MITTGYEPMGQHLHDAAYCRESIIYFGGCDDVRYVDFMDMFVLNLITNHITEVVCGECGEVVNILGTFGMYLACSSVLVGS